MEYLETYTKYQILVPNWFGTNLERWPSDAARPHAVAKWYWKICAFMFWRYRMNYETGFLVQLNKWTRPWHLTEDWQGLKITPAEHFAGAVGRLEHIAGLK